MLRSDWGIVVTIVGCLGLAGLALWDVKSQPKRAIYCESSAKGAYCRPQQYVTERSGIPSFFERSISNPEPKTGEDHEKRDLAAQEASAIFSFWMVAIAAFSAIVTMIGTIFLYQQIRLTREAVEDTGNATKAMLRQTEIAEMGQRPFVYLERHDYTEFRNSVIDGQHVDFGISFSLRFLNSGPSPAANLIIYSTFGFIAPGHVVPKFPKPEPPSTRGMIGPGAGVSGPEMGFGGDQYEKFKRGEVRVYVYAHVAYSRLGASETEFHTEMCGQLRYGGDAVDPKGNRGPIFHLSVEGLQNTAT
jgi:hypothetical protein